jgi:hypothetical protein
MNHQRLFHTGIITSYPQMGGTYVNYLVCHLRQLIFSLFEETSQMTGVDYDYIFGIVFGSITPPFTSPVDCIETELLSFMEFVSSKNSLLNDLHSQVTTSTSE